MSSHRRVKDIDYDEDELEDYNNEYGDEQNGNGMSAEDAEQMRQGSAAVRAQLDPSIDDVTNKEIEDALWYYYFDVHKSVAYIQKKRAPPTTEPKKQKQPSRFEQAAQKAQKAQTNGTNGAGKKSCFLSLIANDSRGVYRRSEMSGEDLEPKKYPSALANETDMALAKDSSYNCEHDHVEGIPENFFWDTPWLNVAPERLSNMSLERPPVRLGLLGGSAQTKSSKPSKLAALAAARRKAAEEKKQSESQTKPSNDQSDVNTSVQLLDKLNFQSKSGPGSKDNGSSKEIEKSKSSLTGTYSQRSYKRPKQNDLQEVPKEDTPDSKPVSKIQEENVKAEFEANDIRRSSLAEAIFQDLHARANPLHTTFTLLSSPPSPNTKNPFAEPSPDAVVLNAQLRGSKPKPQTQPIASLDPKLPDDGLSDSFDGFNISGPNHTNTSKLSKHKSIDVASELARSTTQKPNANFVVVGHVDHGKSTLMGRLLHDLKLLNSRQFQKLSREAEIAGKSSFHLAWVMDSTSEERARGITVDIATNHFETAKTRYTILDAPGHRDFIPNMIAGASQADFAILVVDAGTNAFEAGLKGQTKEHALLVRSMGISRLIVAVNKMDAASWSQARFDTISQQLTAFLTTAGFSPKTIDVIPCAGLTGINVALPPSSASADGKTSPMPWYTGPTLVEALDASAPAVRNISVPLRMTVSDVYKPGTSAPVSATLCITGRIDTGSVQPGEQLLIQPVNQPALLKTLTLPASSTADSASNSNSNTKETDTNPQADFAIAGQLPTLYLTNLSPEHVASIRPGDVVSSATDHPVQNTSTATIKLLTFEHVLPGPVELHKGRLHAVAHVEELVAVLDKASGAIEKKRPRVLKPGVVARVRVRCEQPVPLEEGNRVVLRLDGVSVGAGLVEGVDG